MIEVIIIVIDIFILKFCVITVNHSARFFCYLFCLLLHCLEIFASGPNNLLGSMFLYNTMYFPVSGPIFLEPS